MATTTGVLKYLRRALAPYRRPLLYGAAIFGAHFVVSVGCFGATPQAWGERVSDVVLHLAMGWMVLRE